MISLDLAGVKCPMNFVKARLFLQKQAPDSEIMITVDHGEASEGLISSLISEGYVCEILSESAEQAKLLVKI